MPKQYRNNEIIDRIDEIIRENRLSVLYKEPYVKRTGTTKEGEFYSEVASQKLLSENIKKLLNEKVQKIPRSNYKLKHTRKINKNSNRDEEILAIKLTGKNLQDLGHVLEYQIPLKSKRSDKGVGKVDLVSINSKSNKAFLIELKAKDNSEGLLKAVLEIATYERQLNMDTFRTHMNIPRESTITKVVLLESGSQGYDEASDLGRRLKLHNLIKHLGIEIFLLEDRVGFKLTRVNI